MKSFKITYKRANGTIDFEVVSAKSNKLNKSIHNYYYNIDAEILSVENV